MKVMLAGSGFSRFSSNGARGIQTLANVKGEGDRCVAYWFVGTPADVGLLDTAVGKAKWKPRGEPSRWKNAIPARKWSGDVGGQLRWKQLAKTLVDDKSPLRGTSDEYRKHGNWTLGIKIGPKALTMNDLEFGKFQAALMRHFHSHSGTAEVKKSHGGHLLDEDPNGLTRRVRQYKSANAIINQHRLYLMYGVEEGRCVAYWMYGPFTESASIPTGAALLLRK